MKREILHALSMSPKLGEVFGLVSQLDDRYTDVILYLEDDVADYCVEIFQRADYSSVQIRCAMRQPPNSMDWVPEYPKQYKRKIRRALAKFWLEYKLLRRA